MKKFMLLILVLVNIAIAQADSAEDAFQRLLKLEGVWEGKYEEYDMKLTYEPISGGTAIMEIMESAGTTMTTVYHKYGDRLMATHYCRFANQPRLVASVSEADPDQIEFHFMDGTNLDKSYMSDVTFKFLGENQFEQTTKFHGHDTVARVLYTRNK
jgi:hypothetical protein